MHGVRFKRTHLQVNKPCKKKTRSAVSAMLHIFRLPVRLHRLTQINRTRGGVWGGDWISTKKVAREQTVVCRCVTTRYTALLLAVFAWVVIASGCGATFRGAIVVDLNSVWRCGWLYITMGKVFCHAWKRETERDRVRVKRSKTSDTAFRSTGWTANMELLRVVRKTSAFWARCIPEETWWNLSKNASTSEYCNLKQLKNADQDKDFLWCGAFA